MATNSDYAQLAAIFTTVDEPTPVCAVGRFVVAWTPACARCGLWLIPYAGRESSGRHVGALDSDA